MNEAETAGEHEYAAEKLIYDHIKDAPRQQIEFANQLDDKMLRIFTAASIVIGLLGLSASGGTINGSWWQTALLFSPLVPYALTAYWTFLHIDPESFHLAMRAVELPEKWQKEDWEVRRALLGEIGNAYCENKPILKDKAWYIRAALVSTGMETALVVMALVLSRLG